MNATPKLWNRKTKMSCWERCMLAWTTNLRMTLICKLFSSSSSGSKYIYIYIYIYIYFHCQKVSFIVSEIHNRVEFWSVPLKNIYPLRYRLMVIILVHCKDLILFILSIKKSLVVFHVLWWVELNIFTKNFECFIIALQTCHSSRFNRDIPIFQYKFRRIPISRFHVWKSRVFV